MVFYGRECCVSSVTRTMKAKYRKLNMQLSIIIIQGRCYVRLKLTRKNFFPRKPLQIKEK